ncbi:MAG TPA: YbaK/EbsC family protein [Gaiellaceae bacterium]|nr:YbaK/EbsC family protein [Gaiellaceae bacterium]
MSLTITHTGHVKLLGELDAADIAYTVMPHPRTLRATDEARVLGVPASAVAKTIVLSTPDGFVRAVLPASEHIDLRKVRDLLGTSEVELATEEQLAGAYPDYELGAVPPFGGGKDRVLLDRRLASSEAVLIEAGVHDASIHLATADLATHANASIVDFCRD